MAQTLSQGAFDSATMTSFGVWLGIQGTRKQSPWNAAMLQRGRPRPRAGSCNLADIIHVLLHVCNTEQDFCETRVLQEGCRGAPSWWRGHVLLSSCQWAQKLQSGLFQQTSRPASQDPNKNENQFCQPSSVAPWDFSRTIFLEFTPDHHRTWTDRLFKRPLSFQPVDLPGELDQRNATCPAVQRAKTWTRWMREILKRSAPAIPSLHKSTWKYHEVASASWICPKYFPKFLKMTTLPILPVKMFGDIFTTYLQSMRNWATIKSWQQLSSSSVS